MNPIIRNFRHVIRRFKLAATLNILGLSVAFAAFMIIMMQLNYNFSFGKHHEDYDKIYRLEIIQDGSISARVSHPFAERFFESSPHIIAGGRRECIGDLLFYVNRDGERHNYIGTLQIITSGFFDVFTFDFVEGSIEGMAPWDDVIIPLSLARKLFGDESAIGKQLFHWILGARTVRAVYRDFPSNDIVENHIFHVSCRDALASRWDMSNFQAFIRVNQASNANFLIDNFKRSFDGREAWGEDFSWEESGRDIRLTALTDIRFTRGVLDDNTPKENRQTLMILFIIAIMIVSIAAINFTNFSMALMPMRVRNINTQRVLGAQKSTIRLMLVVEAIIFCLVSYLVALLFVHLFGEGILGMLMDVDLSLAANPIIVGGTVLVAVFVGICAGLYPSFYITSFAPALALKGNFGLSPKGKKIRNTLISIQFIASLVLIIGASFMYLQNRLMQNADLGYDTDRLIAVSIDRITQMPGADGMQAMRGSRESRSLFAHKLTLHPGIRDVSFARNMLLISDDFANFVRPYRGEMIAAHIISVEYNFLEVLEIDVTEGRSFRREDMDSPGVLVFNETARRRYNMEVGTMFGDFEIIGFMPDIHYGSFRVAVAPMAFGVARGGFMDNAYIKMEAGANRRAVMSHIRSTLAEFDPNFYSLFETHFFDEILQQVYERELKLGWLVLIFSLMVIFISIVGVFGLVVFDSECRRKEIGIRKVHGATTFEIITMFNKAYLTILVICFVISVPIAWIAVSRWLENFAYRTPMYWWVFVLAFVAVAAITILTVTIQNWRVANEDPVKSIKTE